MSKSGQYAKYVHRFLVEGDKYPAFAVGEWNEEQAQYTCPLDSRTAKLTGCHTEFSKKIERLSNRYYGPKAYQMAYSRARYLYKKTEKGDE